MLERCANLALPSHSVDLVTCYQLRANLESLLQSFRDWETTTRDQSLSPLYWESLDLPRSDSSDAYPLFFPDLMTATSLTFCWAFEIVALNHLDLVQRIIDTLETSGDPLREPLRGQLNCEKTTALAEMICNSMPYFMRPETKLWGPASTYFTFMTAVQIFKDNEQYCGPQLLYCRQIFSCLHEMQVYFPGIQALLPL